jgi:phosphatidylserine decarboxylase
MRLTRDGLREILISTVLLGISGGAAVYWSFTVSPWYWLAAVPLLAMWLFVLSFFRDPERIVPGGPGLLAAPADGTVTEITRLEGYEGIDGPAMRIGIFLSIFDVHVNRAPCGGRVVEAKHRLGEFLDARSPDSGSRNEANTIVIEPEGGLPGPIIVRQIAGLIARRIVCRAKPGAMLRRGERIGMIKFGSRTELIVPADRGLEAVVKVNDHVHGGSTVLMRVASGTKVNGESDVWGQQAVG